MAVSENHFVHDGCQRARAAAIDKIRVEVAEEFAQRIESADWLQRWRLKREMRREIERRLNRVAPPWGLYVKS